MEILESVYKISDICIFCYYTVTLFRFVMRYSPVLVSLTNKNKDVLHRSTLEKQLELERKALGVGYK